MTLGWVLCFSQYIKSECCIFKKTSFVFQLQLIKTLKWPNKGAKYWNMWVTKIWNLFLNPKRAGLFCLSQVRGGGGGRPPPQISAVERRKILQFGTYVELVNTHVLTKLQCWKSKRFWIMQIYVNYMHVFLFLIITDKMRPFRAFKMFWYCRRNI